MSAGIVRIVTGANFERDVLGSSRPTLVAFGASWCGPCRLMAPGLRALASKEKDRLAIYKLDVDANPAVAACHKVETFPVCILFRDGEEVARLDGYMPLRKVEAALKPHLGAA